MEDALAFAPPGCKPLGFRVRTSGAAGRSDRPGPKTRHLPLGAIADSIRSDWMGAPAAAAAKSRQWSGYYITGRLNAAVYRDDCLFDGPDPDMPVRGLRKYLGAASHLFDPSTSKAELLSLTYDDEGGNMSRGVVEAKWKIDGSIMLPWRPKVKPWTGSTRYHIDDKDGLIYLHEESWDIGVWEAFVCAVLPDLGDKIWGGGAANGANNGANNGAPTTTTPRTKQHNHSK